MSDANDDLPAEANCRMAFNYRVSVSGRVTALELIAGAFDEERFLTEVVEALKRPEFSLRIISRMENGNLRTVAFGSIGLDDQ